MQVVETIVVESAGVDIVHGIYRDFPTRYTDRAGNRYSVLFDIVRRAPRWQRGALPH